MDRSWASVPGLGVRTAIKLLTIVGDGSAFPTAAHLALAPASPTPTAGPTTTAREPPANGTTPR